MQRPAVAVCRPRKGLQTSASGRTRKSSTSAEVHISAIHDPWANLAFEDWLFRKSLPHETTLFVYRNSPCVVIGRNQNPWTEINMNLLRSTGIPFVRRRSGGGTVYHDLGNTNYCIISPRANFNRKESATLVSHALRKLRIPAYVNERNDICVEQFKVSGSAYKLTNNRAYHHGTMLIDARLEDLRGLLKPNTVATSSKAISSVSSPVRNLEEWSAMIDHESFVKAVQTEFWDKYGQGELSARIFDMETLRSKPEIHEASDELRTWDWQYGQTPEFSVDLHGKVHGVGKLNAKITSKRAIVLSCEFNCSEGSSRYDDSLRSLSEQLIGDRYGTFDRAGAWLQQQQDPIPSLKGTLDWLKRACNT